MASPMSQVEKMRNFFEIVMVVGRKESESRSLQKSQILARPLIDAVQRLLQIFQRIGYAEAQVAFSELAEGCAGKRGDAGLLQQCVSQRLRFPSRLRDIGKSVECPFRFGARK